MSRKYGALLAVLLLFSGIVSASSVGAAPSNFHFEEVEPGETIEKQIYVITNAADELVVNPSVSTGPSDRHFSDNPELANEISEDDISDWIEVDEEAVVDPNESETNELSDGTSVNSNGQFAFQLNAPNDAEPGYYFGRIRLNPQMDRGDEGAGTVNWGESTPIFSFYVSGSAERDIEIIDVEGIRTGEDRVQIVKQLQNRGTVTASLVGGNLTVIDDSGSEVGDIRFGSARLNPGEVAELESTWSSEEVGGGEYEVEGIGDYRSGQAHISGEFTLTDVIREPVDIDEPESEQDSETDMPFTLIFIAIIFIGLLLYFLEIDILWISAILGFFGASAFILFSTASSYLIILLFITTGVILYYAN